MLLLLLQLKIGIFIPVKLLLRKSSIIIRISSCAFRKRQLFTIAIFRVKLYLLSISLKAGCWIIRDPALISSCSGTSYYKLRSFASIYELLIWKLNCDAIAILRSSSELSISLSSHLVKAWAVSIHLLSIDWNRLIALNSHCRVHFLQL